MWDRRRQKRGLVEEFVFIQIGRDDGGRVLNVSEDGLSFEVFSPIPRNGPVPFWFSSNLRDRIEAIGQLAWTDDSGKVGGMKFLNLAPQDRERIGAWVKQVSKSESPEPQREVSVAPIPEISNIPEIAPIVPPSVPVAPLSSSNEWAPSPAALPDHLTAEKSEQEVPASRESFYASHLVPLERFLTATRRQFILGVLTGLLVSAVVAVPAFKYSGNHKLVSTTQAAPSPPDLAKPDSQPGAPGVVSSPQAPRAPSSVASTEAATGNARRSDQPGTRPEDPFAVALPQARQRSPRASSVGQVTSTSATQPRADVPAPTGSKKTSATPQQLWSSVQAGNTKAAVMLADLYIRGDGVPVNCNQARVLLLVASEKSNTDAIRKLRELDKTGCPQP